MRFTFQSTSSSNSINVYNTHRINKICLKDIKKQQNIFVNILETSFRLLDMYEHVQTLKNVILKLL